MKGLAGSDLAQTRKSCKKERLAARSSSKGAIVGMIFGQGASDSRHGRRRLRYSQTRRPPLLRAKQAHELTAAARRTEGDALLIESQAKMLLADEYDAAWDRCRSAPRTNAPLSI